nr:hypothetical protein [Tanacetum cinerariifolium]
MSSLFADTHNVVAILEKSDVAEGFEQIIDFLSGSYIHYALTMNPHIYISCIKQFWNSVSVKRSGDVTSTAMASAVICLSKGQRFNFSNISALSCYHSGSCSLKITSGIPSTSWIFFGAILILDPLGKVTFIFSVSKIFTTKYGNFLDSLVFLPVDLVFVLFIFFTSLFATLSNVVAILKKSDAAKVKRSDDVTRLQALVDREKIVILEDVIREILQLDDAEGVVCLPN